MTRSGLSSEKNKYKKIFDSLPVAIVELDYSALAFFLKKFRSQMKGHKDVRKFLLSHLSPIKQALHNIRVIDANKAAYQMYGVSTPRSLLKRLTRTFTTTAVDLFMEQMVALADGAWDFSGEFKHRSSGRTVQDLFLSVTVPRESRASLEHVIITLQDITSWKRIERQLRKRVQLDALTKLLNQIAVMERLEEELVRARRYGLNLSCMMVDLDFFKVINDKFGHQRGDQILKRVAHMIRACFRKMDIVGRYGGDEFLVILPETKPQNAKYAAMRLQKIFSATVFKYKKVISFHITLSIGIVGYPAKKAGDARELAALADKAMYSCKMAGRNRVAVL